MLSDNSQRVLLQLARSTIENKLKIKDNPKINPVDYPELNINAGVFVTLHKKGELRGCIGNFDFSAKLIDQIERMAIAAAFQDPRFSPLKQTEFNEINIEISVLSPPKIITDLQEIEVGKHGLIISRGYYHGVLLPQVATEYGWDRETFLDHTCLKAGLPINAWKEPSTRIEIFSAEVFGEKTGLSSKK